MNLKSERLRKLESEHQDLKQWLELGLVPKNDIHKHQQEIEILCEKIDEEKGRLRFLKENGDLDEYVAPKKTQRQPYAEPHTIPDMEGGASTESGTNFESTSAETESTSSGGKETEYTVSDEDDDPFSDKNRWRRGILEDPDSDNW